MRCVEARKTSSLQFVAAIIVAFDWLSLCRLYKVATVSKPTSSAHALVL